MSDLLPVLWLCGPPGVGKSTVAWRLFAESPGAGYLDIDQVGMCFPTIPSDPDRTRLQGRILGRTVANFRAAGASRLIVSGCVDAKHGVHSEYLADADLSVLRLSCDPASLRGRLIGRDGNADMLTGDDELPYPSLDTTGRTPGETLAAVRAWWEAGRWAGEPVAPRGSWPEPVDATGGILWLCGATGVGKSTVGWSVAEAFRAAGHTTGFVDLQQLGFLQPATNDRLRAANLAAVWESFSAYGATRLVVVGNPADVRRYAEALPNATVRLVRLHAGPAELHARIRQRGRGGGPNLAGDDLRGQPAEVLDRAHEAAVAQAEAMDRAGPGDARIDTDGRPVADLAREISARM